MNFFAFLSVLIPVAIAYLLYDTYKVNVSVSARAVSKDFIARVVSQLLMLVGIINGLEFIPDIAIFETLAKVLGFVSEKLDSVWINATELISAVYALYKIIFKDPVDAIVAQYVKLKYSKINTASNANSLIEYVKQSAY